MVLQDKKVIYDLLFRTSAETLLEVVRDPRHLAQRSASSESCIRGAKNSPHIRMCLVSYRLSPDRTRWIRSRDNCFLPKQVLGELFRGKFVDALKEAFQNGQLHFHGDLKLLAQPKIFATWLRPLHRQDWVVYLKRLFGGPEYVVRYLGRYTHCVAICSHRPVSFSDGQITFRWRDSAHHNEQKLLTLSLDEFLRRFLLHILPKVWVQSLRAPYALSPTAPVPCC